MQDVVELNLVGYPGALGRVAAIIEPVDKDNSPTPIILTACTLNQQAEFVVIPTVMVQLVTNPVDEMISVNVTPEVL